MKTLLTLLTIVVLAASACWLTAADADTRCYEMRIYYAAPGRLGDLESRFRDHTCALFAKHGFTNIGYWTPLENPDNKIIYIIASPNREAHSKAWTEFGKDPEWQEVVKATESKSRLITKVESYFLKTTDFSPLVKPSSAAAPRTFELRTYTAAPGKLDALQARFRDHTVALFAKHGMTSVGYWTALETKPENTLIYILAHKSKEAGAEAFADFRKDPDWIAAKSASETNGPLTTKVESVFMAPEVFSPIK